MQKEYAIIGVVTLLVLGGITFYSYRQDTAPGALDAFAACLVEKGATFYGTFWCPYCQSQKKLFGNSAKHLPYVECSTPNGKEQLPICTEKGIKGYPTWEYADGSRDGGKVTLERLAEKTGCALPASAETATEDDTVGSSSSVTE
jgi:thiol-disulfide isomerase/thioredoxin